MIPDFEDGVLGVRRDANALAVVAMTIGASGYDDPICGIASDLVSVSNRLARAKNAADVKEAYKELVVARGKTGDPKKLKWSKVAELRPLMKNALPSITTDVKRLSRNEKTFLRGANARKVINDSTILAAIALGCRENVDETLAPEEDDVWREYCERLAAAAIEFNKQANDVVAKKGSFEEMKEAFKAVEETCSSTCHEKFGGKSAE